MTENETPVITSSDSKNQKSNNSLKLFIVLTILLAILSAFLGWQVLKEKDIIVNETTAKEKAEADKTEMLTKLKNMEGEYDQLIAEYEDLDSIFSKEKDRIVRLENEIKNFKGSTADYKKKVSELEARLSDYLKQIEELKSQNKTLTTENIKVKSTLDSTINKNAELESEKADLDKKVQAGSTLKAYEIISDGIRLKGTQEIPTKKAKKVQKIRTCFLLSENAIASKGNKTIYLRISGPDQMILSKGTDENYMFEFEGKKIVYSLKKDIYYDNKAMDLCFYWERTKDFKKGVYNVDIFIDNYRLGSSSFNLE